MQHIIFDLDGTLIKSKQEIIKTYQAVFREIIPPKKTDIESINYHATLQTVLETVYGNDAENIAHAKSLFSAYYDVSQFEETPLYDGVYDTLRTLKRRGNYLYIATNKRETPTLRVLKLKKIEHFFSAIMATDTRGEKYNKEAMISELKKRYKFDQGWMIGDAPDDIMAGKNQNLTTVAVTYGNEDKHSLAKHMPSYLIDSFSQLLHLINHFSHIACL